MTKILSATFAATTVLLAGCGSGEKQSSAAYRPAPFSQLTIPDDAPAKPPGSLPPKLSESECRDIAETADRLAHRGLNAGPPWPVPIQKLNPIEVSYDRGNVIITLYRDEQVERGFYYIPRLSLSSQSREVNNLEWGLKALTDELYEYRRMKRVR